MSRHVPAIAVREGGGGGGGRGEESCWCNGRDFEINRKKMRWLRSPEDDILFVYCVRIVCVVMMMCVRACVRGWECGGSVQSGAWT